MDFRIRQTSTASPAEPGGLPLTLGILDRSTLEQLGSLQIAPNDDEYQDGISSITSDDNTVYLSVEYRYEQSGRTNFVAVDKGGRGVVKDAHVEEGVGTLVMVNGELLSCICRPSSNQRGCAALNPESLKSTPRVGKVCIRSNSPSGYSVIASSNEPFDTVADAVTKDYLVAQVPGTNDESYVFRSKKEGEYSKSLKANVSVMWSHQVDGTNALISIKAVRGGQRILLLDVPTGSVRTLLGLPTSPSRFSVIATHKQMMLIGLGRDLLVYDLNKFRLLRYIKNFIPADFKDNGHGLDSNRIDRLIVDRDQLIALTFYGENSQIVQLQELSNFVDEVK